MRISRERLAALSSETGFEARILEKVMRLYGILNAFQEHPFLKGKFSLKGGTAINLFLSSIPRLSVDIDLNYIGSLDKEIMLAERPEIERVIEAVLDLLPDMGEIVPDLLTPDKYMQERISGRPLLLWKASHVKKHREG